LGALKWRYATKQFDASRKISEADWKALESALVLSPSSFGLQPWKFVVVRSPEVRQQLLPHAWGQKQVVDASHLVVFAALKTIRPEQVQRYMDRIAEVRQSPVEKTYPFREMLVGFVEQMNGNHLPWTTRQAYIALSQLLTSAALLKIDATPMEGIVPAKFDEVLGLDKTDYATVVAATLGYRHADDRFAAYEKVRFNASDVVQYV
jgi:nitroreductase